MPVFLVFSSFTQFKFKLILLINSGNTKVKFKTKINIPDLVYTKPVNGLLSHWPIFVNLRLDTGLSTN